MQRKETKLLPTASLELGCRFDVSTAGLQLNLKLNSNRYEDGDYCLCLVVGIFRFSNLDGEPEYPI